MKTNLSGAWRVYVRAIIFVLAVLFSAGAVGLAFAETLPWMLFLTPGFSLVTGVLVVAPSVAAGGWRFAAWMVAAYGFILLAEVVGVATGAVFGEYAYGPTLGWAFRGVPVLIAFNWALVVNGAVCLAGRIAAPLSGVGRRMAIIGLAGLIVVLFDFIMEPVAVRLDYWHWIGGAVPPPELRGLVCDRRPGGGGASAAGMDFQGPGHDRTLGRDLCGDADRVVPGAARPLALAGELRTEREESGENRAFPVEWRGVG